MNIVKLKVLSAVTKPMLPEQCGLLLCQGFTTDMYKSIATHSFCCNWLFISLLDSAG